MWAPTTFRGGIIKIFVDYLDNFMKLFFDDSSVYEHQKDRIDHLDKCLIKCHKVGVSLYP